VSALLNKLQNMRNIKVLRVSERKNFSHVYASIMENGKGAFLQNVQKYLTVLSTRATFSLLSRLVNIQH
jgi:hypothetical protein